MSELTCGIWHESGSKLAKRWLKSGVALANQRKGRSVHELFAGAFRNKSSICDHACLPKEKHTRIPPKRAKFIGTFRFGPFFGLLCRVRLLIEGGGGNRPKAAPRRLALLTPKLMIVYRVSVERGRCRGPLKV